MAREDGTPVCDCDGGILSISVGNIANGNQVGKLSCRKCGKLRLADIGVRNGGRAKHRIKT